MIPMNLPGITVHAHGPLATGGEGGSGSACKNRRLLRQRARAGGPPRRRREQRLAVATTHLEVEHGGMGGSPTGA
jgi:hypothetical protein